MRVLKTPSPPPRHIRQGKYISVVAGECFQLVCSTTSMQQAYGAKPLSSFTVRILFHTVNTDDSVNFKNISAAIIVCAWCKWPAHTSLVLPLALGPFLLSEVAFYENRPQKMSHWSIPSGWRIRMFRRSDAEFLLLRKPKWRDQWNKILAQSVS
jgi:hypothetical protein